MHTTTLGAWHVQDVQALYNSLYLSIFHSASQYLSSSSRMSLANAIGPFFHTDKTDIYRYLFTFMKNETIGMQTKNSFVVHAIQW